MSIHFYLTDKNLGAVVVVVAAVVGVVKRANLWRKRRIEMRGRNFCWTKMTWMRRKWRPLAAAIDAEVLLDSRAAVVDAVERLGSLAAMTVVADVATLLG